MKLPQSLLYLSLVISLEAHSLCLNPKDGVQVATIDYPKLKENSGIDFSNTHKGIFWTMNDQKGPDIFAIGVDGKNYGKFEIIGANKIDWEDIALAKCSHAPAKDCIYIADSGNNNRTRDDFKVYVVEEPRDYKTGVKLGLVETITFKVNGPFNFEAFVVNESKQEFYLISKNDDLNIPKGVTSVFSLQKDKDVASLVATLDFNSLSMTLKGKDKVVTAADFDTASQTLLLGTNNNAFEIKLSDLPDFKNKVRKIKVPKMEQTESIAYYWKDGKVSVVATSEGKNQPLYLIGCE